jgi:pimeloyl-ACP methyl ester carboxylesterase
VFLYLPLPVASEGFYGPLRQIHGAPKLPKIGVPARFFGGERDPLVKIAWADRLGEYFSAAEGAGHFVHYERPEAANREIVGFFSSLKATE